MCANKMRSDDCTLGRLGRRRAAARARRSLRSAHRAIVPAYSRAQGSVTTERALHRACRYRRCRVCVVAAPRMRNDGGPQQAALRSESKRAVAVPPLLRSAAKGR